MGSNKIRTWDNAMLSEVLGVYFLAQILDLTYQNSFHNSR